MKQGAILRLVALGEERPLNGLTQLSLTRTFSSYVRSIRLDNLLRDSIDEVLGDLMGRRAREGVYEYLEKNCSCHREQISEHLPKLFELLEETFGEASKTIGIEIAKRLFEKFGWEFQHKPNFEFFDYLEAARSKVARELVERAKSSWT